MNYPSHSLSQLLARCHEDEERFCTQYLSMKMIWSSIENCQAVQFRRKSVKVDKTKMKYMRRRDNKEREEGGDKEDICCSQGRLLTMTVFSLLSSENPIPVMVMTSPPCPYPCVGDIVVMVGVRDAS